MAGPRALDPPTLATLAPGAAAGVRDVTVPATPGA